MLLHTVWHSLSHITNINMHHAISCAAVLLPHSSCQFQWRPKRSNRYIIIYYRPNSMIFTDVLIDINHTFVVRAICSCGSRSQPPTLQYWCWSVSVIFGKCASAFVHKYMFETNRHSCFFLGIYCRVVKVCWSVCKTLSHLTNASQWQIQQCHTTSRSREQEKCQS
jgi:hypothetical protein